MIHGFSVGLESSKNWCSRVRGFDVESDHEDQEIEEDELVSEKEEQVRSRCAPHSHLLKKL